MRLETLSIHAGYKPEDTTKAVAVPLYQTASYAFDNAQHGADLFDLVVEGNIYSRVTNPTTAVLEARLAEIEGGVGALVVATGIASIAYAVQALATVGDNIIATKTLYGGTYDLFSNTLTKRGIEVRFIDPDRPEDIAKLADERTKLVFGETIGNPAINVLDIPAFAKAAHAQGIPLIIDNTVASPAVARPIELGADIVVESLTKYINGHGNSLGGAIIDGGKFDWTKSPRFSTFTTPDPHYHNISYVEHFEEKAYIAAVRVRQLRSTGASISPFNSFLILQGLETLALRIERHSSNALKVAQFLQKHPQVSWVNYPGLSDSPFKTIIDRDFNGLASGLLSFGIQGGKAAGIRFIDALQLFTRLVNIGDAKSLATHPASTTHRQLNDDELIEAGVSADMVRLSVGIEHIDDLLDDLHQALSASVLVKVA